MSAAPFMEEYSRKQIRRAGRTIRHWMAAGTPQLEGSEHADLLNALIAVIDYRETFQDPLNRTAVGLRSMYCTVMQIDRAGAHIPVTQRLKRDVQIWHKLRRFPRMDVTLMGDIGGCRALLPDDSKVDALLKRITRYWNLVEPVRDTRRAPSASGYRAVHVIVERGGRRIEIQLRTPKQHEWAVAVERTGQRLGIGLKEGEGPADLQEYFRLASHGLYLEEYGIVPDPEFTADFTVARDRVAGTYFKR